MTSDHSRPNPFDTRAEPAIIANFVNGEGELIARWSATNLLIPSIGETVSFGELKAPSVEDFGTEDADYHLDDELYEVIEVEYTYSEVTTEGEETPPNTGFVSVSVYLSEAEL